MHSNILSHSIDNSIDEQQALAYVAEICRRGANVEFLNVNNFASGDLETFAALSRTQNYAVNTELFIRQGEIGMMNLSNDYIQSLL